LIITSGDCVKCNHSPEEPATGRSAVFSFPCEYEETVMDEGDDLIPEVVHEFLRFTCTRCGYSWTKPCADAGKSGEGA